MGVLEVHEGILEESVFDASKLVGLLLPGGIFVMLTVEHGFPSSVLSEAGFRDCNDALWDAGHFSLCQLYQKPF